MSNINRSRSQLANAFAAADAPTLADVLARLEEAELDARRRGELRSAVRTVGRVLDRPLDAVFIAPRFLRPLLGTVSPAAQNLSPGRWSNVRSLLRAAIAEAGFTVMPGRYLCPLSPAWAERHSALSTRTLRIGLSRFMRFCSARGIAPEHVGAPTFDDFKEALEQEGLLSDPRRVHRETCRCWNVARGTVPRWPDVKVSVPRYRDTFVLDWSAFPAELRDDVEAMLDTALRRDPLSDSSLPRINGTTAVDRRQRLRRIASAAVHGGIEPNRIGSLADLIEIATAKAAITYLLNRHGGSTGTDIHHTAKLLWTVAKHWVQVDEGHLGELAGFKRRLDPGHRGMTAKNWTLLRRFEDRDLALRLVVLADELYAGRIDRQALKMGRAVELQVALAIALLTSIPIRIKNLAGLHVRDFFVSSGEQMHLVVPAEEVKNGIAVEAVLPRHVRGLLDRYLLDVRPVLLRAPSDWLFPGEGPGPKGASLLSQQIAAATERHLGVRITAHQFRHVAGFLYLRENPGAHEVVRRLLGHRSIATTLEFYAGMEDAEALRHYDATFQELRDRGAAAKGRMTSRAGR